APVMEDVFLKGASIGTIAVAGVLVLTQLMESTAKGCSQGTDDMGGANRIIILEEVLYLPVYVILLWLGVSQTTAIVVGLAAGDIINGSLAWGRLVRRRFFAGGA